MILWSAEFATGVESVDAQHQQFINKVNDLEEMSTITNPTVANCEYIIELVDFLESYASFHFSHEEECMARFRCPAFERNRQQHDDFLAFFRAFKQRYTAEGFRPKVLAELHRKAHAWVVSHIMGVDCELRPCVGRQAPAG